MIVTDRNHHPHKVPDPKKAPKIRITWRFTHVVLFVASFLALLILIGLIVIVALSPEGRFHFGSTIYTYLFLGLIALLLLVMAVISAILFANRDGGPGSSALSKTDSDDGGKSSRFPELLEIDRLHPRFESVATDPGLTLSSLCSGFRDYMAGSLGLYYSLPDVRKFVASLACSKTIILQGMSGTGKTSLAVAFGRFIGVPSSVVPVQPMWKERSDLLGYYNEFTGRFNETAILEKLYEASCSDRMFVIVLDELNIARVEYYFAEFLSLLELPPSSSRDLVVASCGAPGDPRRMERGRIALPDNVWFLGTANNDDSTFSISDKVYDRAMVMDLNSRAEPYSPEGKQGEVSLSAKGFASLVGAAKASASISAGGLKEIGELDSYLVSAFHVTFGNRIMMQIRAYVPVFLACGGTEKEAIDDILAKKVLRKLESQNPVYVKSRAQELIAKLDEVFGQDSMPECASFVRALANNG